MKPRARPESAPQRTPIPEEAAYIDLVRTADALSRPLAQLIKTEDLSPPQYNVLRILRGSPEGLTCGEIGNRMITRDPDITRLLDRMEKRGLISRGRDGKDRRVVLTTITAEGLDLLARLDQPIRDTHRRLLGRLGAARLTALRQLLDACRAGMG
jgi:DNA-binding MarR family transcriptional regulator